MSESEVAVQIDGGVVSDSLYSVALDDDAGGTITFVAAPAAGHSLVVLSDPDFTQQIEFENGSRWLAGPVNEANDRDRKSVV